MKIMRYSIQTRDGIFVKRYGFLFLPKIWVKIMVKATDTFKLLQKE